MRKVTTLLNIIPLRAAPSHRSEMVSQVLFGEGLLLSGEEEGDFAKVRMQETNYEGWVQCSQIMDVDLWQSHPNTIVGLDEVFMSNGLCTIKLYHGTPVAALRMQIGAEVFKIDGILRSATLTDFAVEFPRLVAYYLRTPYMWGGRSICGMDCSGFSQMVYAHFGIMLKRDAYQQAEAGEIVNFLSEIKSGDLAFFDNEQGRITHVGVMIDAETIIHAAGEVRIDKMDQQGIYNEDLDRYSHKLRIVKRYF